MAGVGWPRNSAAPVMRRWFPDAFGPVGRCVPSVAPDAPKGYPAPCIRPVGPISGDLIGGEGRSILVRGKGRWSRSAPSHPQSPAVRGFPRLGQGGRISARDILRWSETRQTQVFQGFEACRQINPSFQRLSSEGICPESHTLSEFFCRPRDKSPYFLHNDKRIFPQSA